MMLNINRPLIAVALVILLLSVSAAAQENEQPDPLMVRMQALEQMIGSSGQESLEAFIQEHVDPDFIDQLGRKKLVAFLQRIRKLCARAGRIMAEPVGDNGVLLNFETDQDIHSVQFKIQSSPPHQIYQLSLSEGGLPGRVETKKISWDQLPAQLQDAAAGGFSGTVLVVRDGEIVVHQGFGMADRERGVPNSSRTVYAIGSTPIDFTKAAILKLEDMGRLKTSDLLTKYFPEVPADKKTITLDHLIQARSGLPNFHHIPRQDKDYDLTWIDREEAIRRILGKELLFPPGQGEAHSHSAWSVLAAVIEIVSGQSYGEFLQQHFFEPLGMNSTGLYPLARKLDPDQVAVGYGGERVGQINSPAHWGETSWLVMGSMISNPGDLYK
jgi:CubicO group peptidase (beta-lactamase class C family)